jgi:hypothetical protein
MPAPPARAAREQRAHEGRAPAQADASARAHRGEPVEPQPSHLQAVKPAIQPASRERSSPTPPPKRAAVSASVAREVRHDADDTPQLHREPTAPRAVPSWHLISVETSQERPLPATAPVRERPRRRSRAPVAPASERSRLPEVKSFSASRPSSFGRAETPVTRATPAPIVEIHRPDTRAVTAVSKPHAAEVAQEPQWPALPDESGDAAPVSSRWPVLPREGSEWPSDETLEDRTVRSAHEAFLRAEQRGGRWNA